jgi:hypothetical protein
METILSKITESARGKVCEMRLEGCLPGTETVVFAHLNKDSGMGMKSRVGEFHWGCPMCHHCHSTVDGSILTNYDPEWLELLHLRATIRYQKKLAKDGII